MRIVFSYARRVAGELTLPDGVRSTTQRLAVLRAVTESSGSFTVAELHDRAYVRCRPEHHHHLVCTSCGGVEETELCAAPSDSELQRRHGFRPAAHELDIYGTCRRCA